MSINCGPMSDDVRAAAAAPSLSRGVALLFSVACGLAVANVYFAQPLLDTIADTFGISHANVGIVITVTQIGYGVGLLLVVPLGDLLDRRRLILGQSLLSVLALLAVAFAPTGVALLAGMAMVGLLAVVTQVLVAYAAHLADPSERGRIVGVVTSGIVIGILLARSVSGTLSDLFGWRSVYLVSAGRDAVGHRRAQSGAAPADRAQCARLLSTLDRLGVHAVRRGAGAAHSCGSRVADLCRDHDAADADGAAARGATVLAIGIRRSVCSASPALLVRSVRRGQAGCRIEDLRNGQPASD